MKTLSGLLAIILTVGVSFSTLAHPTTPKHPKTKTSATSNSNATIAVSISSLNDAKGLKVSALNETQAPLSVSIFDQEGVAVYTEEIKGEQINRSFNLGSLPAGTYTIFVSSDNYSTYKEISIQ